MKDCLLHARTYERVKTRLPETAGAIRFLLMDDQGVVTVAGTTEEIAQPDPAIAFGNGDIWFHPCARPFFRAVLDASHLDWFQSAAAGVDNKALASILAKARLYTTNHRQAEAMAEWAIWQALDWMKRGAEHRTNQKAGVWERLDQMEIMGSHWLIIGFGAIGKALARRVKALGGQVTGVRRSAGSDPDCDRMIPPDEVSSVLPAADVVLLSMPHTPETENFANAEFFSAMREDKTLFLNLGRGALVDEAALIAGLEVGRPADAALDVTAIEPLPEASPLWHHQQITLTPHDSSQTQGTLIRADETFLENFRRYVKGETLDHLMS